MNSGEEIDMNKDFVYLILFIGAFVAGLIPMIMQAKEIKEANTLIVLLLKVLEQVEEENK